MNEAIKNRIEQVRCGEVPDGYKVTQSGILPLNWHAEQLSYHLQEYSEFSNDVVSFPVATSSREGLLLQSKYYQQQRFDETRLGYHVVPQGYITYRHMSDDDIFHFNINTFGQKLLVSPEYPVFSTKPSLRTILLIEYLNLSDRFLYYCRAQKKGSTRTRLYFKNLQKFYMPIAPLPEQQKITEILTCCDQVIALKKQLLNEKRRQKQWLMKKLLDPESGVRLQQYEGAWDVDRLDKLVFLVKDRYDPQYDQRTVSSVELENIESVTGRLINWNNDKFQKSTKTVFKEGDILFGKLRPYLRKAFVASFDGVCSTEIWVMRRKDRRINLKYLYYVLMSEEFISLASSTTGTKMPRAEWGLVGSFCVRVPSITEQEGIASILSAADHEIDLLDQELFQWQQKKKSLMQLLLTGIVRVNV